MKVRYKCKECNADRLVEVPERKQAVDIVFWINEIVMRRVGIDHQFRNCKAVTFDLMIPFTEETQIIGQTGNPKLDAKPAGDYQSDEEN